jgi:hypothetical protein
LWILRSATLYRLSPQRTDTTSPARRAGILLEVGQALNHQRTLFAYLAGRPSTSSMGCTYLGRPPKGPQHCSKFAGCTDCRPTCAVDCAHSRCWHNYASMERYRTPSRFSSVVSTVSSPIRLRSSRVLAAHGAERQKSVGRPTSKQ